MTIQKDYSIQSETGDDTVAIHTLHNMVFGPGRFARTAFLLRETACDAHELAFVARDNTSSMLIGSVRFSHIQIRAGSLQTFSIEGQEFAQNQKTRALEHVSQKWESVLGKKTCSNKELEHGNESIKNGRALERLDGKRKYFREKEALLLGPLTVHPGWRGVGVGKALVRIGLQHAKKAGHQFILLIGDAPYYGPLGFQSTIPGQFILPSPVDPARLLIASLADGDVKRVHGQVYGGNQPH